MREHPEAYSDEGARPADGDEAPRSDRRAGADDPARAARRGRGRVRHCLLERRQPDPRPLGAPRGRAGRAGRARRRQRRPPSHAAGREPGALRRRRRAGRGPGAAVRRDGRRYAARFSVRALDVTVDSSVLWVGAGLAMAAAVLLAYVPRLPSPHAPAGLGLATGSIRITPGTNRRLRIFATTQIAFSFVLLAGAGMLLATLVAMQTASHRLRHAAGAGLRHPAVGDGLRRRQGPRLLPGSDAAHRRAPGVEGVAVGSFVPWRDAGSHGPGVAFRVEGYTPAEGEEDPRARIRTCRASASSPCSASRSSPAATSRTSDRDDGEPVSIVSQSVAQRLFPNGDAVNRHMWWTDPYFGKTRASPHRRRGRRRGRRERDREPALTIYMPVRQIGLAGRLFVRAAGDPYALVPAVTRVIREISADQPVERAATLEDVRAEVLSPERLNAFVFSGICRHRAAHCRRRCRGRAGLLGERAHARVRHSAGSRVRAAAPAGPRALGGRDDCRDWDRGGRGGRLRARRIVARDSSSTCSCRGQCR